MTYRETAHAVRAGRVVWGPFPTRWGYLVGCLGLLFFALVTGFAALDHERLACDASGACVLERALHDDTSVRREELGEVRVSIETGSKGSKHGVVVIDRAPRAPALRLMQQTPSAAESTAAELRHRLATEGPFVVDVRGPIWMLAVSAALVGGAVWLFVAGLRGIGRFAIDVVQGGTALEVRRSVLGVPLGAVVVPLEGAVDVIVERGVIPTFWRARGQPNPPGGRLVLVTRRPEPRPLAAALLPGLTTHLRAACELRRLLDMPPTRGGVEEELAAVQPITTPLASRLVLIWSGLFGGGVGGLLLGVVPVIALRKAGAGEQVVGVGLSACALVGAVLGATIAVRATGPRMPR